MSAKKTSANGQSPKERQLQAARAMYSAIRKLDWNDDKYEALAIAALAYKSADEIHRCPLCGGWRQDAWAGEHDETCPGNKSVKMTPKLLSALAAFEEALETLKTERYADRDGDPENTGR